MRIGLRHRVALLALCVMVLLPIARAQNPDSVAPEESAARAKHIVGQLVQAMGGPAYLGMSKRQCDGRRALISHTGELSGYVAFKDSWRYPDQERTDYVAHGRNTLLGYMIGVQDLDITHGGQVITLFSGDRGWVMDRSGVSEMPDTSVSEFQEGLRQSVDNLLRLRMKEAGTTYRWAGLDTVDLREVDWVEISTSDGRTVRLAVDRSTHLLVRSMVATKDEESGRGHEDVVVYTNYQPRDGVQVPLQITREKDGRRAAQIFYENCRVNPDLPADFFTKEALEKRFLDTGGKQKNKK